MAQSLTPPLPSAKNSNRHRHSTAPTTNSPYAPTTTLRTSLGELLTPITETSSQAAVHTNSLTNNTQSRSQSRKKAATNSQSTTLEVTALQEQTASMD